MGFYWSYTLLLYIAAHSYVLLVLTLCTCESTLLVLYIA